MRSTATRSSDGVVELGVKFYDTAILCQSGTSEHYVGRTLRDFAKRDDVPLLGVSNHNLAKIKQASEILKAYGLNSPL